MNRLKAKKNKAAGKKTIQKGSRDLNLAGRVNKQQRRINEDDLSELSVLGYDDIF